MEDLRALRNQAVHKSDVALSPEQRALERMKGHKRDDYHPRRKSETRTDLDTLSGRCNTSPQHDMQGMIAQWPRWARILAVTVLAGAIVVGIPAIRAPILRAAGWALVVDDAVEPADVIVVAADADGAGVLEAADLVHSGIATRVAVFAAPPDSVDREFIRRGVAYEDAAARSARQLRSLGVTAIEQIPRAVAGTEAESRALRAWCDQHQVRSVVVVSTADHSRRLRRVLRRSMKGHETRVTVRPARHSAFDPDRWWETRDGIRTQIIELEKLLLDVMRHPIS